MISPGEVDRCRTSVDVARRCKKLKARQRCRCARSTTPVVTQDVSNVSTPHYLHLVRRTDCWLSILRRRRSCCRDLQQKKEMRSASCIRTRAVPFSVFLSVGGIGQNSIRGKRVGGVRSRQMNLLFLQVYSRTRGPAQRGSVKSFRIIETGYRGLSVRVSACLSFFPNLNAENE